jgi:hypothetical protein
MAIVIVIVFVPVTANYILLLIEGLVCGRLFCKTIPTLNRQGEQECHDGTHVDFLVAQTLRGMLANASIEIFFIQFYNCTSTGLAQDKFPMIPNNDSVQSSRY